MFGCLALPRGFSRTGSLFIKPLMRTSPGVVYFSLWLPGSGLAMFPLPLTGWGKWWWCRVGRSKGLFIHLLAACPQQPFFHTPDWPTLV